MDYNLNVIMFLIYVVAELFINDFTTSRLLPRVFDSA